MISDAHPPTTRERVREIFGGSGFRWFFGARIVSTYGDGFFQIAAAAVLLFEEPGDNPVMTLLVIAAVTMIPFSVIGPFSGPFIDRWERRKIVTRVPLLRAIAAASVPSTGAIFGTDSIAFYAVVLFVLSANRFFLATMSAVLPQLVPEDDLLVANSASSAGGSIANVAGQACGSVVARFLGGTVTSAFSAVTFAASAIIARRVPAHRGFLPARAPLWDSIKAVARELVAGAGQVRGAPRVVYALSGIGTMQFLVGAMTGLLLWFFIIDLGLDIGSAFGFLVPLAVGIGLGVVLVPLAAGRVRHTLLIPVAYGIAGAGTLVASITMTVPALVVGSFLVGISYAFAKIPTDTIVQQDMADAFRGRAFAIYDMLFNVARVLGIAVVALAYQGNGDTQAYVRTVTVVSFAIAAVFVVWERRIGMGLFSRRGRERAPDVGALLLPGELVSVRSYAGARADEEPRAIVVGGHELPVEGIEWRAMVEDEGRRSRVFVVLVGGRRVRLTHRDDEGWEIERILGDLPVLSGISEEQEPGR